MSGRDRRHFARELHKAETAHATITAEAKAAHQAADIALAKAHQLDCEEWTARQFIGGPEDPSPPIANAIHGGCELLEVRCRHCRNEQLVDLTELIWPREKPVHTLRGVLFCKPCQQTYGRKRRPELVALRSRDDGRSAPAAAAR